MSIHDILLKNVVVTTRKMSDCGRCENCHIAVLFWIAAVHGIYCGVPLDCRSSSSLLWHITAAVYGTAAIYVF